MKRSTLILIILLNCVALSVLADPSNPRAIRGNITVLSSELGEFGTVKKYPVSNAIDGNPQTAYVFEKRSTSFETLVGLLFDFKSTLEVDGISLINGFAKNDTLYKLNNAIKTFKLILPNHHVYNYTCSETTAFQNFNFPKQAVNWMILIVTGERKGTKYDDLCISEISPIVKNINLIDEQPKYIINNNGGEYDSDLIIDLRSQRKFDTEKFDFACGAQNPFFINDSTVVYQDECDDSTYVEILYLNKMTAKTIKNKQLDNFILVKAISETMFIILKKDTEEYYKFSTVTNKFISTNYRIKKNFDYWRWSERLDHDLSNYYKKIE